MYKNIGTGGTKKKKDILIYFNIGTLIKFHLLSLIYVCTIFILDFWIAYHIKWIIQSTYLTI